jgi:hypothetical protein
MEPGVIRRCSGNRAMPAALSSKDNVQDRNAGPPAVCEC